MAWRRLPLPLRLGIIVPLWVGVAWVAPPAGFWWLGKALGLPGWPPQPWSWLGLALALPGMAGALVCVLAFALRGKGTPAPLDPPTHLVVSGPYAYCRNPMMASQFAVSAGEALVVQSWLFLVALALGFVAVHFFLKAWEEPQLMTRFGETYEEYRRNVPMWWPRLKGWRP